MDQLRQRARKEPPNGTDVPAKVAREAALTRGRILIVERQSQRYLRQLAYEQELIAWQGPGYPAELSSVLSRFEKHAAAVIETGRGWWPLLIRADRRLRQLDAGYVLRHVMEELSELWFDAAPSEDCSAIGEFRCVVAQTEIDAARTCEVCGARGRMMRQGDWFVTLCWDDAEERGARLMGSDDDFDSVAPRTGTRESRPSTPSSRTAATTQPAGQRRQQQRIEALRRRIDSRTAAWPSAREFAWRVGVGPHQLEQLRLEGRVSAMKLLDGLWRFAPWQLGSNQQLVPHLSDVMAGAPFGITSYDLNTLMTHPDDRLHGQSPNEWLLAGGPMSTVQHILAHIDTSSEVDSWL